MVILEKGTRSHKGGNDIRSHRETSTLVLLGNFGENFGEAFFDLAGHHFTGSVVAFDESEFVVVVEKEAQVGERDVDAEIGTVKSLKFGSVATTAFGRADFGADGLRRIGEEDGRIEVGRAHFGVEALESGEEFGMDQSGLVLVKSAGSFAGHAKVRILVDGAGNQAADFEFGIEEMRERRAEGGSSLDGRKSPFADVIDVEEAKAAAESIHSDNTLQADDIRIHSANIVKVVEDESFGDVESDGDDVLDVLQSPFLNVFHRNVSEQHLFVCSHLDH